MYSRMLPTEGRLIRDLRWLMIPLKWRGSVIFQEAVFGSFPQEAATQICLLVQCEQ